MGFTEGQRVTVKASIGVGPTGTVVSVEGNEVEVRLDGKTKPKLYPASKLTPVRAELQLIERTFDSTAHTVTADELAVAARPAAPILPPPRRVTYDAPPLRPQPKSEGPYRDRAYLAFVKGHPCCGCKSTTGIDAHHWADLEVQKRAAGQKVDDVYTVPLCRACHDHVHGPGAGALPKMNRGMTSRIFLLAQVRLLAAYIKRAA